jgi:hypothetical protein
MLKAVEDSTNADAAAGASETPSSRLTEAQVSTCKDQGINVPLAATKLTDLRGELQPALVAVGERIASLTNAMSDFERRNNSQFSDVANSMRRTVESLGQRIAAIEDARSPIQELDELRTYTGGLATTLTELVNIPAEIRDLSSRVDEALTASANGPPALTRTSLPAMPTVGGSVQASPDNTGLAAPLPPAFTAGNFTGPSSSADGGVAFTPAAPSSGPTRSNPNHTGASAPYTPPNSGHAFTSQTTRVDVRVGPIQEIPGQARPDFYTNAILGHMANMPPRPYVNVLFAGARGTPNFINGRAFLSIRFRTRVLAETFVSTIERHAIPELAMLTTRIVRETTIEDGAMMNA